MNNFVFQAWRVSEVDSSERIQPQIQSDTWHNNFPEEPPTRRRPGRKRKRRPQQKNPVADTVTQERYPYPERPSQAYMETNAQVPATPRNRRKKIEDTANEWQAESSERPIRRGRRRKRPTSNGRPELSKFIEQQPEEIRLESILDPSEITDERIYTDTEGIRQLIEQNKSEGDDQKEVLTEKTYIDLREQKIENKVKQQNNTTEDKSTSDFSLELSDTSRRPNFDGAIASEKGNFKDKIRHKEFGVMKTSKKIKVRLREIVFTSLY